MLELSRSFRAVARAGRALAALREQFGPWLRFDARFWVGAFAGLVIVAAWVFVDIQVRKDERQEIEEAEREADNLAFAFEEHVARTVRGVDEAVLTLREEYLRKGPAIDIPALQRAGLLASPLFIRVNIIGPDGYLLRSSGPFDPLYLGDREPASLAMAGSDRELYISRPQIGRGSGRWSIHFARRISAPDGALLGVAVIALDADYFADFYASVNLGRDGVIGLVGRDGIVRSRRGDSLAAGESAPDFGTETLFEKLKTSGMGHYTYRAAHDGLVRRVTYRAVADYPLVVTVGVAEIDATRAVADRRETYRLAAGVFSVLTVAWAALLIGAFSRQMRVVSVLAERDRQRTDAEDSLRHSEARFRALFEQAPVAIGVSTLGGCMIDANPAFLSLFRFRSLHELRRARAMDLFDPAYHEALGRTHALTDSGVDAGQIWQNVRVRRDGTRFHGETRVLSMRFPTGRVRVGFTVDISERTRMQAELQQAKDRLDLALRAARLAIFDIDLVAGAAVVSTQWAELFGTAAGEQGCTLRVLEEMVHPQDRRRVRHAFMKMLRGTAADYYTHYRIHTPRGEWRWVEVRARVVERDPAGRAVRAAGVIADITAHKQFELALQETEAKLGLVTAKVPGMVFELLQREGDGRLAFFFVSDGSRELFGRAPDELLKNADLLIAALGDGDRQSFVESRAASARDLSLWTWEGRVAAPGGQARWVQLRATPRRTEDACILWDGIVVDVTAAKETEIALTETKGRLRELAAHNDTIREEERARIARELHDELGQLLTGVKLHLSAAVPADEAARAQHVYVMQLVEQAITTTRNVVADLRPPALDHGLGAAVSWLADRFAHRTGIGCEVAVPDHDVPLSDQCATALFRILQESLTNVAKHACATEVRIALGLGEGCVRMEVADNGRGFETREPGADRTFGVLGMRERIAMLGGDLTISGARGSGTTVSVEIPLEEMAA